MSSRCDFEFTNRKNPKRHCATPSAERRTYSESYEHRAPVPAPEWNRLPTVDYDTFDGLSNLNEPLDNLSLQERHRSKLTNRKKVLAYQRSHHQRLAELLAAQQQAAQCDTSEA